MLKEPLMLKEPVQANCLLSAARPLWFLPARKAERSISAKSHPMSKVRFSNMLARKRTGRKPEEFRAPEAYESRG